ncbi:hypothetical protein LWI28_028134 [Acer negundo]|uniref:Uncharacterized protein n=1 Tax=Acer negundo TaxID=4023 RepID=A0AAD5IQ50_ACENE|nr:hypothetical protein LWI28_028134 [Acer negundo]
MAVPLKHCFLLSLLVALSLQGFEMSEAARHLLDTPAAPTLSTATLPSLPSMPSFLNPPYQRCQLTQKRQYHSMFQ